MLPFIAAALVLATKYYLLASLLRRQGYEVDRWIYFGFSVDLSELYREDQVDFRTATSDLVIFVFGEPPARIVPPTMTSLQEYYGFTPYPALLSHRSQSVSLISQSFDEVDVGINGTVDSQGPLGFGMINGTSLITGLQSDIALKLWVNGHPAKTEHLALAESVPGDNGEVVVSGDSQVTESPAVRDVCIIGRLATSESPFDFVGGIDIELVVLECPVNGSCSVVDTTLMESLANGYLELDNTLSVEGSLPDPDVVIGAATPMNVSINLDDSTNRTGVTSTSMRPSTYLPSGRVAFCTLLLLCGISLAAVRIAMALCASTIDTLYSKTGVVEQRNFSVDPALVPLPEALENELEIDPLDVPLPDSDDSDLSVADEFERKTEVVERWNLSVEPASVPLPEPSEDKFSIDPLDVALRVPEPEVKPFDHPLSDSFNPWMESTSHAGPSVSITPDITADGDNEHCPESIVSEDLMLQAELDAALRGSIFSTEINPSLVSYVFGSDGGQGNGDKGRAPSAPEEGKGKGKGKEERKLFSKLLRKGPSISSIPRMWAKASKEVDANH